MKNKKNVKNVAYCNIVTATKRCSKKRIYSINNAINAYFEACGGEDYTRTSHAWRDMRIDVYWDNPCEILQALTRRLERNLIKYEEKYFQEFEKSIWAVSSGASVLRDSKNYVEWYWGLSAEDAYPENANWDDEELAEMQEALSDVHNAIVRCCFELYCYAYNYGNMTDILF